MNNSWYKGRTVLRPKKRSWPGRPAVTRRDPKLVSKRHPKRMEKVNVQSVTASEICARYTMLCFMFFQCLNIRKININNKGWKRDNKLHSTVMKCEKQKTIGTGTK